MVTLGDIAATFGLALHGDASLPIEGLCGVTDNLPGRLSFVTSGKHARLAATSSIPAFVVKPGARIEGKSCLEHAAPEYAIARIATLFERSSFSQSDLIHPSAVIHPSARLGPHVQSGPVAEDPFGFMSECEPELERGDELSAYRMVPRVRTGDDPLLWWKLHANLYPGLASATRDHLAARATSTDSERAFSGARHLVSEFRCSMARDTIRKCMLIKSWLKVLEE